MVKRSIEQYLRTLNLRPEMGKLSRTSFSRIRGKNVASTKDRENVGNGKLTCSVQKETKAVSSMKVISVQNLRHRLLSHQNFRRSRMGKIQREQKVLEAEVHLGDFLVCRARIISKELAQLHSVKSGTLQNACSSRPRVVADLVKSARMHIVRLMNSLAKGPKRLMTKVL